jgi:diaminohydroxyphosphoribosylaminopyrimidine deaminase/5-amino-6-(5-phosphoribosylamino)uracil reductase
VATAGEVGRTPDGRVDLVAVLARLYQEGRRHVLLEGGPRLAAAFLDAGLIDEVLVYLAPTLLGAGRSALEDGAVATLTEAHHAELRDVTRFGPDLRLRYSITQPA